MTGPKERISQLAGQGALRTSRFLRWWRDALLAWLPARWKWALGWSPARLLLRRQGEELIVQREIAAVCSDVARLPWPTPPAVLEAALETPLRRLPRHWLLPAAQVLRRPLRLPAAALTRLHDVVGFEIDRQTPFRADQVVHDVRVLAPVGEAQVDVELVVLPRTQLEQWQQELGPLAADLAGLDVAGDEGAALQINLLPPAQRRRQVNPQRRRELLLLAVSTVLLMLAGERVVDNREAAADRLRAQVEQSARQARDVSDQRALLQSLVNGARFLDEKSARQPGALQVWNELSQLLPAGTYLEKMGIENGSLQLIGLTREANQLVSLLEPSPLWRRVNLTGVLQADQAANGRDRFTLTAELQAAPTRPAPVQETADAASAKQP